MPHNPQIHNRQSIRLAGYDYSSAGVYFITICCHHRNHFFGEIENGRMQLNEIGKIALAYLQEIPQHFPQVEMGEFVVMPNHVHCILVLGRKPGDVDSVGIRHVESLRNQHYRNEYGKPIAGSVSVIIQQYKSSVKRWCNQKGFEYFKWQSRFHDHIIRDVQSFRHISDYIISNPRKWETDKFYDQ